MSETIKDLIENATAQGFKSNVIKPIMGLMIIFFIGAIGSTYFKVEYLPLLFTILLGLCGFLALFSYCYCLIKDPNLLRSEKYNLEKTAIEKVSLIGDSTSRPQIAMPHSEYVIVEPSQLQRNGNE